MASREPTYMRWKKSVLKKLKELNAICGVDACVIINSEYDQEPVIWPTMKEVQRTMVRFKLTPETEHIKNLFDLERCVKKMIAQAEEKKEKQSMENREKKMTIILKQCLDGEIDLEDLSLQELEDLEGLVGRSGKYIDERIQALGLQEARGLMED